MSFYVTISQLLWYATNNAPSVIITIIKINVQLDILTRNLLTDDSEHISSSYILLYHIILRIIKLVKQDSFNFFTISPKIMCFWQAELLERQWDNSPLRETPRLLSRVLKPGWISGLRASLPSWKWFIRLTSVATPADLLVTTMAAERFSIYVLAHVQALVELEVQTCIFHIFETEASIN